MSQEPLIERLESIQRQQWILAAGVLVGLGLGLYSFYKLPASQEEPTFAPIPDDDFAGLSDESEKRHRLDAFEKDLALARSGDAGINALGKDVASIREEM